MNLKKGDRVKPIEHPELKGEIIDAMVVKFIKDEIPIDRVLYILDWGGRYFADELELI